MSQKRRKKSGNTFLEGQLLIAMPAMSDKRFARSVIYVCAHSSEGAMGLIINQRASHITFPGLLQQLEIVKKSAESKLTSEMRSMHVHFGGPVETGRGFVLHSADYFASGSTLPIADNFCLTATMDILKAMAQGEGPDKALLALGYAGWGAGQLESEIHSNGWLTCAADSEIVFSRDLDQKYERALSKIGIDPSHLVNDCGHC
jgi:putative transcriptional regulator